MKLLFVYLVADVERVGWVGATARLRWARHLALLRELSTRGADSVRRGDEDLGCLLDCLIVRETHFLEDVGESDGEELL
jgi:hypothetical protein